MNQDQVLGVIRIILPGALAWLVGAGYITNDAAGQITAAVVTLVAAAWSIWAHTPANAVARVVEMPQTSVSDAGKTITIHDPALADVAKANATPHTRG